jgi:nitrogen fixation-related uncharacterized protein
VFRRALEGGQFDDLERHGHSILEDEKTPHAGEKAARDHGNETLSEDVDRGQ